MSADVERAGLDDRFFEASPLPHENIAIVVQGAEPETTLDAARRPVAALAADSDRFRDVYLPALLQLRVLRPQHPKVSS